MSSPARAACRAAVGRSARPASVLLPFAALSVLLAGCITVSGRVGAVSGLDDVAARVNEQQGTDFSGSVVTTGYGIGAEALSVIGVQLARMVGSQTSSGPSGTVQELRLEQADAELNLAYPVLRRERFSISPGLSLASRTTTLQYLRDGALVSGGDGTALILRPHLKAVTSVGAYVVASAGVGYEVAFLEDPIGGPGGVPFRSGSPGPQANATLTVFFCSGCVGN